MFFIQPKHSFGPSWGRICSISYIPSVGGFRRNAYLYATERQLERGGHCVSTHLLVPQANRPLEVNAKFKGSIVFLPGSLGSWKSGLVPDLGMMHGTVIQDPMETWRESGKDACFNDSNVLFGSNRLNMIHFEPSSALTQPRTATSRCCQAASIALA